MSKYTNNIQNAKNVLNLKGKRTRIEEKKENQGL